MRNQICILCLLSLLNCVAFCQESPHNIDQIVSDFRSEYFKELENDKVTGLSLVILNRDSIIWADNYGWADKENRIKANSETKYLIGSITKLFTALSVMQLHEKGVLNIDEPFQKYLSSFNIKSRFGEASDITVRNILTHHSGIPEDVWIHKFSKTPLLLSEITDIVNQSYTCYPPEKLWVYSNSGYCLLGSMIEELSSGSYYNYIEKNIFTSIGLTNSGFYNDYGQHNEFAQAYDKNQNLLVEYPISDAPAGSIYSTITDMAKFAQDILTGDVLLRKETLNEMFRVQNMDVELDLDHRMGLGFFISNSALEAGRIYEHGGATLCHRSQIYIAPDCGLAAVVLSNSETAANSFRMVKRNLIVEVSKSLGFKSENTPNLLKEVSFSNHAVDELKQFSGTYASPGMTYLMDWDNEMLHTKIYGTDFYLEFDGKHTFIPTISKDMKFYFEEMDGHIILMEEKPWGDVNIFAEKVISPDVINDYWKNRFGKYISVNQDEKDMPIVQEITLKEANSLPVMEFVAIGNRPVQLGLKRLSDSESIVLGLGRMGGESVFFQTEGHYNYMIFKGIKLKQE